jgi:hypothetical protein
MHIHLVLGPTLAVLIKERLEYDILSLKDIKTHIQSISIFELHATLLEMATKERVLKFIVMDEETRGARIRLASKKRYFGLYTSEWPFDDLY